MGALESGQKQVDSKTGDMSQRANTAMVIMILLGFLVPIMISSMSYMGYYELNMQSFLWYFRVGLYGFDFQFIPPYLMFSMFPFLILRIVPALVMYRYYQGKMTRRRAFIGVTVGDILFLAISIPSLLFSMMYMSGYLAFPTPLQMLIGFLILWRFPIPEPTRPWEDIEKGKSWWEKEPTKEPELKDDKKEEETPW